MEEWQELINSISEARHNKVLECQMAKFDKLCQHKTGCHSNLTKNSNSNLTYNQGSGHSNFSIDTRVTTTSLTSTSSTWVKNLSSTPLTEAQECLLAHRPKFTIVLKCPSNGDYTWQWKMHAPN